MANLNGLVNGITTNLTIHDQDESGDTYYYYGYLGDGGKIVIMRATTDSTEYRYYLNTESEPDTTPVRTYEAVWAAKATYTYRKVTQL